MGLELVALLQPPEGYRTVIKSAAFRIKIILWISRVSLECDPKDPDDGRGI